jgi:hypothetical protein
MKAKFYLFVFISLIMGFILILNTGLYAQEVRKPKKIIKEETSSFKLKYGTGLTTRYIWRGLDLARSPALLPYGMASFSNFEISLYGIFGLFENAAKHPDFVKPQFPEETNPFFLQRIAFNQIITNLFYRIKAGFGEIRIGITDYYFPDGLVKEVEVDSNGVETITYPPSTWLNWEDNGEGAHTIEINLRFAGNKKFPIWFLVAYNVYNDPNNSLYLETGYTFNVLLNKLTLYLGTAVGASSWYQFNFKDGAFRGDYMTSFGLTFSREIYLEDWLIIDFALSDIVNFYKERNTILFTTTLKIE